MPLGDRTTPSRRSVLTCKPAFPGGRFALAWLCWRFTRDTKVSRRACLTSLSAGAVLPEAGLFATFFAAGLAATLAAALAAGLAFAGAGFAAAADVGFTATGVVGFAVEVPACGAGLAVAAGAGFAPAGVAGFACARKPGAAAAIKIPSPRVIAERIVLSFPLSASQPHQPEACFRLRKPPRHQRAW